MNVGDDRESDATPRPMITDASLRGTARLLLVGGAEQESGMLIAFGYRVSVANDATTAAMLLGGGIVFDLVVSNGCFAQEEGALDAAVRALRSPPRQLHVVDETSAPGGAQRVLCKPFSSRELLEAVRDALA